MCPSSTQPSPLLAAASRMLAGSHEPSSSVKASAAMVSPAAMPGSSCCRAASSGLASRAVAASTALARYGPPYRPAPSSSSTMACSANEKPDAAVLLGDRDALQAQLRARLRPHLEVDLAGVHQLPDPGQRRPVGHEPPDGVPQFFLLLAGTECHAPSSVPDLPSGPVAISTSRAST